MTRPRLFGVGVDPLSMKQSVDACVALIERRRFAQHVVLNAGKVVMMQDQPALRDVVSGCDIVNADGQSVVWAGRVLGVPFPERVAGIDLMCELLTVAEQRGFPVYFLGATTEVLGSFLKTAEARWPSLMVAGSRNGYFEDDEGVAREISSSGARLLFVGISSPRKELFLCSQAESLGGLLAMGVGGSFDVLAGKTARAPEWMQNAGLEWFYRFMQEPRRMWRRYLVGNARFAGVVVTSLLGFGVEPVESGVRP